MHERHQLLENLRWTKDRVDKIHKRRREAAYLNGKPRFSLGIICGLTLIMYKPLEWLLLYATDITGPAMPLISILGLLLPSVLYCLVKGIEYKYRKTLRRKNLLMIMIEEKEFTDQVTDKSIVPKHYWYPFAVDRFIQYMSHDKVSDIEEAIRLFEREGTQNNKASTLIKEQANTRIIVDHKPGLEIVWF